MGTKVGARTGVIVRIGIALGDKLGGPGIKSGAGVAEGMGTGAGVKTLVAAGVDCLAAGSLIAGAEAGSAEVDP